MRVATRPIVVHESVAVCNAGVVTNIRLACSKIFVHIIHNIIAVSWMRNRKPRAIRYDLGSTEVPGDQEAMRPRVSMLVVPPRLPTSTIDVYHTVSE